MSDQTYDDVDDLDDEQQEQSKPNWRRELERKAKKADEFDRAAQAAKRELAFYKAGLPMEDPRMAYFVKGYDGDNSPDAIRKAASDAGFLPAGSADTALDTEVQQHQQISDASAGATVSGRLTQSDVLALATKAGSAAPRGMEAAAYMAVLAEHGMTQMHRPPQ